MSNLKPFNSQTARNAAQKSAIVRYAGNTKPRLLLLTDSQIKYLETVPNASKLVRQLLEQHIANQGR